MALFQNISDKYNAAIRQGASRNGRAIVETLKADSARPSTVTEKPQAYFQGQHASHYAQFLREAYPRANGEILPVAPNYVRTWCETAADIYRTGQPQRKGATDAETERIRWLSRAANLESVLPEAEARAHAGNQIFLRAWRNPKTDKLEVTRHWPHTVWVVADMAAPQHLAQSHALLAKRSDTLYELWRRVANGWEAEQIDTSTNSPRITPLFDGVYRGRLPWVSMGTSLPENGPYICDNADMITSANHQMLLWSEVVHVARLQGHNPVWYKGAADDIRPEGGVAGITNLGPDGEMGVLAVNPQLSQLLDLVDSYSGAVARSRNQSPRAFMTTPSKMPLNSGVALRVENQLSEETRPQRVALYRRMEVEELLPILDEVERFQAPKSMRRAPTAQIDWNTVEVTFPAAPVIEDLSQRSLRMEHAANNGWISPARAAVEAGFYDTLEQAIEAGVSSELERMADTGDELGQAGDRGPSSSIQSETA